MLSTSEFWFRTVCHKRDDVCDDCYISLSYILSQMSSDFRKEVKLVEAILRILKDISQGQWVTEGLQLEKTLQNQI